MPHHVVVTSQQPVCPHGVPVGAYCQGCHQQWLAAQAQRPIVVQTPKRTSTVGCIFGVILAPIVLIAIFLIIGLLTQ